MKKKKKALTVLWSVDMHYEEHEGDCKYALFSVAKDGWYYEVFYWGCCNVYSAESLDDAKAYIRKKIEEFKNR